MFDPKLWADFFQHIDLLEILQASGDTLIMLMAALALSLFLGLPMGVFLWLWGPRGLSPNGVLHSLLSLIINVLRSIPFVILFILLIPITVALVGTSLGIEGAIPPLVIAAAPFFARLVETALSEVDPSVIEASEAMGASTPQIIRYTLLPEAFPSLLAATTVTAIALVSYTAMAGVVGAGGLGDLAVRYGYQRFQTDVMLVTVGLIILLVQGLQTLGDYWVFRVYRR